MPYKYPAAIRGNILPLILNNFSGGWNPRDAPSELADTESPDCINVTLDERGGVVKRLGLVRLGSGTSLVNSPQNIFSWTSAGKFVVQDGAAVKTTTNWVDFTTIHTFTTAERAAFCDFNNFLVSVHPTDKAAGFDGTTWTPVSTSPRGNCIAVWQNKVWISGDPSAPSRVYACAPGDHNVWNITVDFVDVREKDGLPVTALGAGQGMDISGRPGLLVFKLDSVHRINDSRSNVTGATPTFGQYTTLHNHAGAVGALSVVSTQFGQIVFIGTRGIYVCDGVNAPVLASAKLQPFFDSQEINLAATSKWCAGVYNDRVIFSLTRGAGQTTNNFSLEFHPTMGWFTPHNFGASCFCETIGTVAAPDRDLFGGHPTAPKVLNIFHSGADEGVPITARWQSRWFEPAGGYEIRMRRLIIAGRGIFTLYTKTDYALGQGVPSQFASPLLGGIWGSAIWGQDLWGGPQYESYSPFWSLGYGRSVAFELIETSDQATFAPPILKDGSAQEVGNFALYGLKLDYVRLGYT